MSRFLTRHKIYIVKKAPGSEPFFTLRKKLMKLLSLLLISLSFNLFASTDVALVKMIRGDVQIKSKDGVSAKAKKGMWLNQGQTVLTGKKSFARLVFKDKTSSNIGANSELEIKSFKKGKAGLLNLIKGQIRTKVVKDTLNQDKSKLFIKTKTAAMGVRGTDFHVSVGQDFKTTVLTYEGAVSMVQFSKDIRNITGNLDRILNESESVIVTEGRFSSTSSNKGTVNLPVKIAPTQLTKLKDNLGLRESNNQYAKNTDNNVKAITPPGISAQTAFNDDSSKDEETFFVPEPSTNGEPDEASKTDPQYTAFQPPPPEGVDNGEQHAPAAGGFIDLATGNYIEPPKGAMFDPNTETFIVPKNFGEVDTRTGEFLPPDPESFNYDSERAPSSHDTIGFIGEHKFVPPHPGEHGPDQFGPNGEQDPNAGIDGIAFNNDFFDENIEDLDPCLVDINTCQEFNAPPPSEVGQPAFLNFTVNFPEG